MEIPRGQKLIQKKRASTEKSFRSNPFLGSNKGSVSDLARQVKSATFFRCRKKIPSDEYEVRGAAGTMDPLTPNRVAFPGLAGVAHELPLLSPLEVEEDGQKLSAAAL